MIYASTQPTEAPALRMINIIVIITIKYLLLIIIIIDYYYYYYYYHYYYYFSTRFQIELLYDLPCFIFSTYFICIMYSICTINSFGSMY